MNDDWVANAPISADVIAQYKREWAKRGFPDVDCAPGKRGRNPDCENEPVSQPTEEQWLWIAVILNAIDDLRGQTNWALAACHCYHDGQPCGHVVNGSASKGMRAGMKQCPFYHTNQQCAARWFRTMEFVQLCDALGLDAGYIRKQIKIK